MSTAAAIDALCAALERDGGTELAAAAGALRQRLNGPLRVAVAGRVKAGKSTLLNAVVGERLAPTDAGECTRIVTVYRESHRYRVSALLPGGRRKELRFSRPGGVLEIDLSGFEPAAIDRLDIEWPSSRLRTITLIDTPGLDSIDVASDAATRRYFDSESDHADRADAVIYLVRHVHATDVGFLEAFRQAPGVATSPVNAVAVLSRADELGGGRLGAMESAARIAARYSADPRIRALAGEVLPAAALLAQTAATLEEREFAWLRQLAAADTAETDDALLSVDRFRDPLRTPLTVEVRVQLLERLGLFGLRTAVSLIRDGHALTSAQLARQLEEISGVRALRDLLTARFAANAQRLKLRSALSELSRIARAARESEPALARRLQGELERIALSAYELDELDVQHGILSGELPFDENERAEITRLFSAGSDAERLGLEAESPPEAVRQAALSAIERWRGKAADPLTPRAVAHASETVARSCERIFGRLAAGGAAAGSR